jgi:O-antigen ligase
MAVLTYVSLWQGALFLSFPLPLWFDDLRLSDWKNYMVIFLLFFLVLASIKNIRQMQILLLLICLSMLAVNRNYINTMRHRDLSVFSNEVRDEGSMGYAGVNGLGALEAQMSVFLLGIYSVHKDTKARVGYLLLLGTCLVSATYTLSRGAYLAVLVGALFIGTLKNRKLLVVLAIFLLTWQTLVPNGVRERVFMTENSNGELESSAGDRVTLWENAMEIISGNPVIGTGFDTYKFMHAVGPYEDTHNYYVKVMLETGLIGLIIFLAIISLMFRAGFSLYRAVQAEDFLRGLGLGVAGMLVATIVSNIFGDRWSYIEETGFTWVLVAMALRGMMIVREQEATAQTPAVSQPLVTSPGFQHARGRLLGWQTGANSH